MNNNDNSNNNHDKSINNINNDNNIASLILFLFLFIELGNLIHTDGPIYERIFCPTLVFKSSVIIS